MFRLKKVVIVTSVKVGNVKTFVEGQWRGRPKKRRGNEREKKKQPNPSSIHKAKRTTPRFTRHSPGYKCPPTSQIHHHPHKKTSSHLPPNSKCASSPLLVITLLLLLTSIQAHQSIQQILDDAKHHMSANRFNEALTAYEMAIAHALRDLSKVLELNPKFTAAFLQRGRQYLKECNMTEALTAQETMEAAETHYKAKVYEAAIETECYLALGEKEMAIGDLSRAAKLQPDSTEVLYRVGTLRLSIGETSEALSAIKECLMKFDPEHGRCKGLFRELKKLEKSVKKVESLIGSGGGRGGLVEKTEKIGARTLMQKSYAMVCQAYTEIKDGPLGLKWCNKAIELNEHDVESLCNQGAEVVEGGGTEGLLKILGVSRTASKREIKKGYRKLAQEWHPDKYKGELGKEAVLKKMSDINEAYETLMDDEKRARVDNGEDPNEQAQAYQQHPFFHQQGGFPFGGGFGGGGGQTFRFNF
ncbi:hypothetical protein BC829DRAFT_411420 [Chytridium lagenaria]|nr:hypothetical protein BC829DRAFT_411420 [Chytridium lagenaria]